jgi:putative ABC transport system substrate-binding protein
MGRRPERRPAWASSIFSGHHHVVVDGLRQGLRELGLEEGKPLVLDVRETPADHKAAEAAASDLERGNVDLLYTVTSTVTLAAKRATTRPPILFYVGTDPVTTQLVESLAKPGGRMTGIHGLTRELTAKRLEILKEILPKLGRVLTFYHGSDPRAADAARLGREAARQLNVHLLARPVASTEELRQGLQKMRPGETQAYMFSTDARITSQAELIIAAARAKKLPTMAHEETLVLMGALASYGSSYPDIGRMSAKYVQRILAGAPPKDLPVESYDKVTLALNLRIAREIGLAIPQSVRVRADRLIE